MRASHGGQTYHDSAGWTIYVPPGWHALRFSDSNGGVRSAGIQLSNVRLPAPALPPGTGLAIEVNGQVLPPRGVGLVIATDANHSLARYKVAVPPLPLPWPDGSRGWILASAPPRSPIYQWLRFRVHGAMFAASAVIGWKASRSAQKALGRIVRSIKPTPAIRR